MAAPLKPLSAIDSISLSMQRARQQLFQPFRLSFWWRMAVVAFFAGEFASYSFNVGSPGGSGGSGHSNKYFLAAPDWDVLRHLLPWILMGAVVLVVLIFLFLYVHSVFRFILFDSVLTGRCSIRQSWSRRQNQGTRYFVWLIAYTLLMLLALFIVIGLPVLGLWRAGIFSNARDHVALLVLTIFLLLMVFFAFLLVSWVIGTIVKDLLIPIMALDDVSVGQAWRSYKPTLVQQKGSAAAYLGMKLLLAIGLGIVVGIVSFFVFLILLIPSVIYFLAMSGLMSSGRVGLVVGILLTALGGVMLLALIFAISGILSVPLAVFFQSYALYYLGSRYQRLRELLWPAPPESGTPSASPMPA